MFVSSSMRASTSSAPFGTVAMWMVTIEVAAHAVLAVMSLGWGNAEVKAAVAAQLQHTPMPSQELIDPLRGVLARHES
mgnify:CR=1 FL=1